MTMIRDQQDILKKKWAGVCEVYKATESNSHKASGRRIPPPTPQLGQILRVTSADINLSQKNASLMAAKVLALLSGDLNHNNVAQAKKILKDLLN